MLLRYRRGSLAVFAAFAASCANEAEPPPAPPSAGSLEERGRGLFMTYGCGSCHGAQGRGDGPVAASLDPRPRDLSNSSGYVQGRSLAAVADTIRLGVRSAAISPMPSYSHLDEADRHAIATWIVSLQSRSSDVDVRGAWLRAVPPGSPSTAAYFTVSASASTATATAEAIVIVGVHTDAARTAEIHESFTEAGVTSMRRVERVSLAPDGARFAPGGLHVMLVGLITPLQEGTRVPLSLLLESGDEISFSAIVSREAP